MPRRAKGRVRQVTESAPPRPVHLALRFALGDGVALVLAGLTLAHAQLDLHPAVLEVEAQGDQRVTRLLLRFLQPIDLAAVEEQLAGALGLVILQGPGRLVGRNLRVEEKQLPTFSYRIRIRQLDAALAQRLHFRAGERDAAFQLALDVVLEAGAAVLGDDLDVAFAHPVSPSAPLSISRVLPRKAARKRR